MMNNVIRSRISDTIESTLKEWVHRVDRFVTPRKTQFGPQKLRGTSQFERLMGTTGVIDQEISAEALTGLSRDESNMKRLSAARGGRDQHAQEEKLKSRIQNPWESQAFSLRR
jgi:hypothetical protein